MNWRRIWIILGIVVGAGLLAYLLQDVVDLLIIVPLAYFLWALKLWYLSLPQTMWWGVLIVLVLIIFGASLLPEIKPRKKLEIYQRAERGRVEALAAALAKTGKGTYFKWLVANVLGKLTYQMLVQREHGKPRPVFAPLEGDGFHPSQNVQAYLEKGLHGTFADVPNTKWNYLSTPPKTALDHDVADVVNFLESTNSKTF